jgi:tetratricopeptide (TPR) repeat protein
LWLYRLIALVGIPLMFFGGIELALRIAGTGYPASFLVPSATVPGQLRDNYKFAWRFFPPALARSSQPMLVARDKPADVTRVIVLGGSAAMGDPEPAFGFPRMLRAMLELRYPARHFEVINAAVTAVNSHVSLQIAQDCRALSPDAWVVYLGNNEVHGPFGAGTVFGGNRTPLWVIRANLALQRTKTGQFLAARWPGRKVAVPDAWAGMEMFLDQKVRADDPALQRVYDHFRANLLDIFQLAWRDRTPVVVGTVVSNLRDFAPLFSQHSATFSRDNSAAWQASFDAGCAAMQADRWDEAIEAFEQAAAVDDAYAELQYRWGQCLLQLGRADEARKHLVRARDDDTLRFRADSTINQIITATAQERADRGVYLIDAAAELAADSPQHLPGHEVLYEHVHLNFHGNYLLARLFAQQLASALQLDDAGTPSAAWPTEQDCAQHLGWTRYHQMLVAREMLNRLGVAPFTAQLDHAAQRKLLQDELASLVAQLTPDAAHEAIELYRRRVAESPDDWPLRQQFGYLLEAVNDLPTSVEQWRKITELLPHYAEAYCQLGVTLNRAKRYEEAEQALARALTLRPEYARARNSLGICLSQLGRFEEAYQQFSRAIQFNPSYAEAHLNWGLVLVNQGDKRAAVEHFQAALAANPNYLLAHQQLGEFFVSIGQLDEAVSHYESVVRLKPDDPAAHMNLGLLQLKRQKPADAIPHLEQALKLSPTSRLAEQALAQARRLAAQTP